MTEPAEDGLCRSDDGCMDYLNECYDAVGVKLSRMGCENVRVVWIGHGCVQFIDVFE